MTRVPGVMCRVTRLVWAAGSVRMPMSEGVRFRSWIRWGLRKTRFVSVRQRWLDHCAGGAAGFYGGGALGTIGGGLACSPTGPGAAPCAGVGAVAGSVVGGLVGSVVGGALGHKFGQDVCPEEEKDCSEVKQQCLKSCSETSLPTGDVGFKFWNCVNRCMAENGCEGR